MIEIKEQDIEHLLVSYYVNKEHVQFKLRMNMSKSKAKCANIKLMSWLKEKNIQKTYM